VSLEEWGINVVDIFAGPGGLGEGFSSFEAVVGRKTIRPFRIAVSAEKDSTARQTLRLRAFFRRFGNIHDVPDGYYEYVRGERTLESLVADYRKEWEQADQEAMLLELGPETERLHRQIKANVVLTKPWVLVGGPPCQAYSLVGRARNRGIDSYEPELDHRHFLYREYLQILSRFTPNVFIMENVKGILTSTIAGEHIFTKILQDLHDPGKALSGHSGPLYDIYPLSPDSGQAYPADERRDHGRFVVRSEELGIPQGRHRVILMGIRRDAAGNNPGSLKKDDVVTLGDVIKDLPPLRSGISKAIDVSKEWETEIEKQRVRVIAAIGVRRELAETKEALYSVKFRRGLERSSTRVPDRRCKINSSGWYLDPRLDATLNHSTRGHMREDLARYLFCAAYAQVNGGRSPTSHMFPEKLAPSHKSWNAGDFVDRFRVQPMARPASTVTSHLSKDGHHFIHWDATQCRSLTVREAARAQTFPDNYFFLGGRTEQYIQVGNAVPPLLARKIAEAVWNCLK
jgi:DNA (cytosine-5)-methyltransferase 1